jgi:DNA mismatch endonuclease (patch repair protein)
MSAEKRSRLMSRIKGKHTGPERSIATGLAELGLAWEAHIRDLPGCPDFVFRDHMIVVFVDGDFWHGWRFPAWRDKLSEKWEIKLEGNRQRDKKNRAALRRLGWKVIRIWEHQIERDLELCVSRIERALNEQKPRKEAA